MEALCIGKCEEDFYDALEHRLMTMTFWAHKEVLFEKIKQEIEKQEGKKLEEIAKLLIDASRLRKERMLESEKKDEELREKLKEALE